MRFLVVLCLAVAASAPTLAHTALERRQSIDYFATAVVLAHTHGPRMLWSAASAYLDNGPRLAAVAAEGLLMAAAEPFLRRHIYVPGELRFSFARLNSLLSSGGLNVGDVVSNVYSSFRFRLAHLPRLLDALRIPSSFVTRGGCRFSGEEGLLILLNRLHFPGTLADLGQEAGRLPCALSECFGWMIEYIFSTFSHLCDWRSLAVHADNFPRYADAIHARGAPLRFIIGFIDGKLQHVARPGRYQGVLYSGNDRVHGLKWQGIMLPNGMQPFPFGPICGSNHDAEMLRLSDLLPQLRRIAQYLGRAYALYGDLAYPNDRYMVRPFDAPVAGSWQEELNVEMASVRVSVEWGFGKIMSLFQFLNHEENLRVLHQPVGLYYPVANILANCHTCLYGSQTGDYFDLTPPELEEYLSGQMLPVPGVVPGAS